MKSFVLIKNAVIRKSLEITRDSLLLIFTLLSTFRLSCFYYTTYLAFLVLESVLVLYGSYLPVSLCFLSRSISVCGVSRFGGWQLLTSKNYAAATFGRF